MVRKTSFVDEQELDRQIADLDEQLKGYEGLQQRKARLLQIKALVSSLDGSPAAEPAGKGHRANTLTIDAVLSITTAGLIAQILTNQGPMNTAQLLAAARSRGYVGSGEDKKDKKRLLAAIYNASDKIERDADGERWRVKN